MSHYRKSLRTDATGLLLVAGLNAFNGRTSDFRPSDLPAVLVMTPMEENQVAAIGKGALMERRCSLGVLITCDSEDGAFDTLDDLCAIAETALCAPGALPYAKPITLRATQIQSIDAPDGAASVLTASMLFEVVVYTRAGSPAVTR